MLALQAKSVINIVPLPDARPTPLGIIPLIYHRSITITMVSDLSCMGHVFIITRCITTQILFCSTNLYLNDVLISRIFDKTEQSKNFTGINEQKYYAVLPAT